MTRIVVPEPVPFFPIKLSRRLQAQTAERGADSSKRKVGLSRYPGSYSGIAATYNLPCRRGPHGGLRDPHTFSAPGR